MASCFKAAATEEIKTQNDMANRTPIIEMQQAQIEQGGKAVISNLSFKLYEGEFAYLIGKTGSGKSSLLKTLYADLPLSAGQATVTGYHLHGLSKKELPFLRRKLGIVFQDFQLFTDRNVQENLRFIMKATGWGDKIKMQQRIEWALTQVGLPEVEQKFPHQLSGGEQQRVAIARALLNYPQVLLADEPTGNLDPNVANDIHDLFIKINQEEGMAVLMATHHHSFLKRFPARVLLCKEGAVKDVSKEMVQKRMLED